MVRIPYLNNSYLSNYQTTLVDQLRSTNPQLAQLDVRPGSLKNLASLYSQNIQSQQASYKGTISSFTTAVKEVNTSAKALTSKGFFEQKHVTSDSSAVSGQAKAGAKTAQYEVSVSQVATSQRNESSRVNGGAYGSLASGTYTVGITTGSNTEKQVSVNVAATDTNQQALSKFATAINKSNAGVVAEVKNQGSQYYLSVQSKETGSANSFSMRDIQGNGVAELALSHTAQTAQDAKYTVNGTSYQSASNAVSLDNNNVTLQLNKTTTDKVKVTVGEDPNKITDAVSSFVNQYNALNSLVASSDFMTARGEKLLAGVQSLVSRRSSEFSQLGINIDKSSGELSLDEGKLTKALVTSPDKVKQLLTGSSGLARNVANLSTAVLDTSVSNYVKPPSTLNTRNYSTAWMGNAGWSSQNLSSQGLFLDMLV